MKSKCPYAYRTGQFACLRCKAEGRDRTMDFCPHQYLCSQTRAWENTPEAEQCKIRKASFQSFKNNKE